MATTLQFFFLRWFCGLTLLVTNGGIGNNEENVCFVSFKSARCEPTQRETNAEKSTLKTECEPLTTF